MIFPLRDLFLLTAIERKFHCYLQRFLIAKMLSICRVNKPECSVTKRSPLKFSGSFIYCSPRFPSTSTQSTLF